jgi:hypothetical protein
MYQPGGVVVSVVLRVPPLLGLSATLQGIKDSAKLYVEASVELGVAAGVRTSGERVVCEVWCAGRVVDPIFGRVLCVLPCIVCIVLSVDPAEPFYLSAQNSYPPVPPPPQP